MSQEDLYQEAREGLLIAAVRFDPERRIRFATYAAIWVRAQIRRYTEKLSDTITKASPYRAAEIALRRARLDIEASGERVTRGLLLEVSGVSEEYLDLVALHSETLLSLDERLIEGLETSTHPRLAETLSDELSEAEIAEALDAVISASDLYAALPVLTERERLVLTRRFGLDGAREETLAEVGERLSLSRERTRQIQNGALRRLRLTLDERRDI